jgi:MFS transporter, MHS family, shikimate and dehydroshikimate transport protein
MGTQEPAVGKSRSERRALVEAIVASTVGTTIEWYDFFLYGTMAAIVFPGLFFPTGDPFVSRILSFSSFTVGFIARPLGGVFFGYIGDRIGRKSSLVATLLLMGTSTILVGLLPGYDRIGVAAPLILTSLRFAQGIGVGGEWGGAVLLAIEYGHKGKRGFYGSWPQAGVPLGLLTSTVVVWLFQRFLPEQAFLDWGWRVPFYLSGLLIGVGLLIRMRILETPLFARLKETDQLSRSPVTEVLRDHWREVCLAAGSRLAEQSCFYLFALYVLDYGQNVLQVDRSSMLFAVTVAAAAEFAAMPAYGLLSDYLSRKLTFLIGSIVVMAYAFPYFALLETRSLLWIVVAAIGSLAGGHAMIYSVQASLIPELFGTRLRYTGASLGYQLASPFAGGLAPIIAASLAKAFPGHYWPLATYIIVISLISLACVQRLAETSRKNIDL